MSKMTWRQAITTEMANHPGESWDDVDSVTLSKEELDKEFDDGYGLSEGCAFTLWTRHRVYFPAVYDGSEWVASVPRNPSGEKTAHIGGE